MPVSDPPPHGSPFEQTRWSMVIASRNTDDTVRARAALGKLCASYWYPLYAFVRREGHDALDAQDLTQEFFTRLLEKNWLAAVDREKGKFRSFLLAAMRHFLANEWDRAHRLKRGGGVTMLSLDAHTGNNGERDDLHDAGGVTMLSLDAHTAEERYAFEPTDCMTADRLFERRWALTLLEQVLAQVRQEFAAAGRETLFEELKVALTGGKVPYAEVAARLNLSEGAVRMAVHRLRVRYRELLRAEIAETVATEDEIDTEVQHLFAALAT